MYGIDSVQARVDAYRGNPQALEKKYQMSKELIDLLALQKLKTEREAAAREMQLEMAGQQGQPATVAQQREQEALETNKQELMQQQGALMQQQTAQRNQNLQNVMSGNAPRMAPAQQPAQGGLPNLPAPNVATPKAMAAGGIVAFADGDYVDPKQYGNYDPANPAQAADRLNSFREYFKDKYGFDPEAGGLQGLGTRIAGAMGGTSEAAVDLDKYRAMKEGTQNLQRATAPRAPTPVAAAARQAAPQEEEPAPARAPQARPAPAAAPGGAPAAPTGGLGNLGGILSGLMQKSLDPEARAKAAEQERGVAEKYMMPTEEETARRKQMLADVQARNKELYDPERLRDESLTRGLLAAAGRSTIGQTLAGAGLGSLNYDIKMRELARQRMGEEQKQEEEMMGKTQKGREDVYKAGQTAAKEEGDIQKQGMASAAGIVSTQISAAASMANAAAAREANQIQREAMTQNQAMGRYEAALKGEQEGIKAVETAYQKAKSEIQYLPEKERKAAMAQLESDRQLGIDAVQQRWKSVQQAAAVKAGIPTQQSSSSNAGWGKVEQVK
jgi:hypothetical protein